jgi:T-complex protein 1 subunit gamma
LTQSQILGNFFTKSHCALFVQVEDTKALGIYEPLSVKLQVYKTAIETAILLLRIDDIVSGSKKKDDTGAGAGGPTQESMAE